MKQFNQHNFFSSIEGIIMIWIKYSWFMFLVKSILVKVLTLFYLLDENKQLFEERSKAYQKLGTMSLCNDEMSAR